MIRRKETRQIDVGGVAIGGGAPIAIQSMTTVPTEDIAAVSGQINDLAQAGCEVVRVAVPTIEAARAVADIKKEINVPLVVDVHFSYKIAIEAANSGADKVRINPGNLFREDEVRAVIRACSEKGVPIRVGANSGSILTRKDRDRLRSEGRPIECTPELMVEKTVQYLRIFEEEKFSNVVVSLKASSVVQTVETYRAFSAKSDCPLHLGITAAGPALPGTVKSAAGLGALLLDGIGDTIRVSLTGDPVQEVSVAREILEALDIRHFGPTIISCPTCARCSIDLAAEVEALQSRLGDITAPIKIALMGCEVNGPGEAREADIGIAAGKESGALFVKGEVVRSVKRENFVDELLQEIKRNYQS
jgi:(E)-4-hydroxy-3-methylbut-2-enyl-diphosphate synthase